MSSGSKTKPSGFGGGFSTYGSSGFGALASKVDVISSAAKLTKPVGGIAAKPFGSPDEEERNTDDEDDEGSDGDTEEKREDITIEEKKEVFTEQEGEYHCFSTLLYLVGVFTVVERSVLLVIPPVVLWGGPREIITKGPVSSCVTPVSFRHCP